MTSLGVALNTKHEKGHQDAKTKCEDLLLLGQLNVDADKLATQALQESKVEKISLLFTNTSCHLTLNDKTITSRIKTESP